MFCFYSRSLRSISIGTISNDNLHFHSMSSLLVARITALNVNLVTILSNLRVSFEFYLHQYYKK
jgi:hypothetical protein